MFDIILVQHSCKTFWLYLPRKNLKTLILHVISRKMRNRFYIAFMVFAVVVMLIATSMPHHHHNGMLCTIVEYCEEDGRYNDEHTNHAADNHTRCIEDSDYLASKWGFQDNDAAASLIPLFVIVEEFVLSADVYDDDTDVRSMYRQLLYTSADVCSANTLRGPPCLFV